MTTKKGKVSIQDFISTINKTNKSKVAFDISENNPFDVEEWISTGATVLDYTIAKGKKAGIPVKKITELAGLEGTGKSFLAVQTAANAQKMGFKVFFFDTEASANAEFLSEMGVDLSPEKFILLSLPTIESIFEIIESALDNLEGRILFVIDSLANVPSEKEKDMDPNSSVGAKARVLSLAFKRITNKLALKDCCMLVTNQLKTYIPKGPMDRKGMTDPYVTPGGSALDYNASLRIFLTKRTGKSQYVYDEEENFIGSDVIALMKKSRFGTEKRRCNFKILWGKEIGTDNVGSYYIALADAGIINSPSKGWRGVELLDGEVAKFREKDFAEHYEKDENFRKAVDFHVEDLFISRFAKNISEVSDSKT